MERDGDLICKIEDQVTWITLNQPEKMNRLTNQIMLKLAIALETARDDDKIRVVVITGAGDKAFCAGASLDQFEQESILTLKKKLEVFIRICRLFSSLGKPSIAMINGYAMAGGCGLAIMPTFSIASEKAVFATPEINVGLWPMMVMEILFRTVGRKKGLEMICTGETIDAKTAERMGLINKVVPHKELKLHVSALVDKLKSKSASIMKLGLEAFNTASDMEYFKALSYLKDMAVIVSNTPDSREGISAFMEKRKPNWDN